MSPIPTRTLWLNHLERIVTPPLTALAKSEVRMQGRLRALAIAALARSLDPASRDLLNFEKGGQPLVDAAFLAHAFLRAPRRFWEPLDTTPRDRGPDPAP